MIIICLHCKGTKSQVTPESTAPHINWIIFAAC